MGLLAPCTKGPQTAPRGSAFTLTMAPGHSLPPGTSESCSVPSDSLRPRGLQHTSFLCLWNSPDQNTGVVAVPSSRGSSQPSDGTQSPTLQADSLPSEPHQGSEQVVSINYHSFLRKKQSYSQNPSNNP